MLHWLLRFVIPFVILYTIGYYIPGFSALTVSWIILLAGLIMVGDWLMERIFPAHTFGRFQDGIINFLVSTVVIFTVTLGIEHGNVPLSGALIAALVIGVLMTIIPNERSVKKKEEPITDKKSRP